MKGQFTPGNPGKPKGAVNKTTKQVKEVFAEVFAKLQSHKTAKLEKWAAENPTEFYKLAAKLIPIQVGGDPANPIKTTLDVNIIHSDTPIAESEDQVS